NSTRRKICGTRFARKSSRTTPSNPSTRSTQSLRRLHSTSNAIRASSNPSPRSPTSPSQSDMEVVPLPHQSELGQYWNDGQRFVGVPTSIQAAMEAVLQCQQPLRSPKVDA